MSYTSPMPARIAINGFGRIGRASFKIALENPDSEIVAINDLTDGQVLAHLLKYDTAYGVYPRTVTTDTVGSELYLSVDRKKTLVLSEKDPARLPWKDLDVDVVLECTGRFTKDGAAKAHLDAGAKKVIISAPVDGAGDVPTFLKGVNHANYLGQNIISNASCTTNCISPVVAVIHAKFGILKSVMNTVHGITAEQNLVDGPPPGLHNDLRRARAAGYNLIPTTTGAAKATASVVSNLKDKFDGTAIRVPVLVGSISDVIMLVAKKVTAAEVNQAFVEAAAEPFYKGVLDVTSEPLVSSDIIGNSHSSIVDLSMTKVVDGDLVKVMAWYDNEWGYSSRLVEMAILISS